MDAAALQRALRTLTAHAASARAAGRYAEAERALHAAARLAERVSGPDSVELAQADLALGVLLEAVGRPADAEVVLRTAVRNYERAFGHHDARLAEPLCVLGAVRRLRGDLAEAERLYRRVFSVGGGRRARSA